MTDSNDSNDSNDINNLIDHNDSNDSNDVNSSSHTETDDLSISKSKPKNKIGQILETRG